MRARPLFWLASGLLAAFLATEAFWLLVPTRTVQAGTTRVDIPPNLGIVAIARRLADAGVIRSPVAFTALAALRGTARQLRAGEYDIPQNASTLQILEQVESGRVVQHTIVLPEGGSVAELAAGLEAAGLAPADDVIRLARDPVFLRTLQIDAPSVEGYLFPDTYQFVRGAPLEELLARMVQRLRVKLTPELSDRARARGLTPHQLLTLASIIEREAVVRDEMPLISAVFWNRLRRNMPLQADPTVQYAVAKGRRALSRVDLLVDHPYNTYRRTGLPPGPIASPGIAAIEAAVTPAAVDYLYFVSMDDRRHYFSTTITQHNAAVGRYRLARAR
jgi:UPF0755 protein